MKASLLLPSLMAIGSLCTHLNAAPLTGSFNIGGTITVTNTNITWMNNNPPFGSTSTIGPGPTGSFNLPGVPGSLVDMTTLTNSTEPVDASGFGPFPFMVFDATSPLAGLSPLDINFIFQGIYGTADCLNPAAVAGQNCTPNPPVTPAKSPFSFVNNPGPNGPQATATFVFSGLTRDHLSTWTGNFTAQFGVPFQSVLAQLAATGSVTNTYSATITVAPVVPEPGPVSLLSIGLGLMLISYKARSRRA